MSDNEHEEAPARIQLSGLWKQEAKSSGKVYYSGNLGQVRLQLWPNQYKTPEDKRPDLILYIVKRKPKPKPTEQTEGAKSDDEVPF